MKLGVRFRGFWGELKLAVRFRGFWGEVKLAVRFRGFWGEVKLGVRFRGFWGELKLAVRFRGFWGELKLAVRFWGVWGEVKLGVRFRGFGGEVKLAVRFADLDEGVVGFEIIGDGGDGGGLGELELDFRDFPSGCLGVDVEFTEGFEFGIEKFEAKGARCLVGKNINDAASDGKLAAGGNGGLALVAKGNELG